MKYFKRTSLLSMFLLAAVANANAEIQIHGTRVIYPAQEREVTVNIDNVGKGPRLLQIWIDSGNEKDTAETAKAPFLVNPPMARVEPGKGQALRIMFTGAELPQDRESVFWLNVLEIPPRPEAGDDSQYLQFAVRSRLKLFYRPASLKEDPLAALDTLTWRLAHDSSGSYLECSNSSEYNVSIANIRFKGTEFPATATPPSGMCAPKTTSKISIPTDAGKQSGKVVFNAINDYGGFVEREASFTQ